jgi:hypothetical protein
MSPGFEMLDQLAHEVLTYQRRRTVSFDATQHLASSAAPAPSPGRASGSERPPQLSDGSGRWFIVSGG